MQAPLSSTASGQQLPTRPPLGLPPITAPPGQYSTTPTEHQPITVATLTRLQASYACSPLVVAEGAGLAHDAGNLLGALRLYCDLLAQPGVLREEHRHYAEELQLLSQRSRTLVDRLLNPAATAGGQSGLVPPVSVPLVIEQCRGLLSAVAHRAVEVVYGAGADAPVQVSRESIERILVNLTKNAAEASSDGATITLRVSRLRGPERASRGGSRGLNRVVLSIEDHGCGMSVAAVKVLTESGSPAVLAAEEQPQQLHGLGMVPGKGPGRGMGLRVVRELVEASCGELRLKSQSGCGTTVEIAWAVSGDLGGDRTEGLGEPAQENGKDGRHVMPYTADGTKRRVSC